MRRAAPRSEAAPPRHTHAPAPHPAVLLSAIRAAIHMEPRRCRAAVVRAAQSFTNQKPVDSVSNGTRLNEEQQAEFEGFTYSIPDANIAAGDDAGEGEGAGERRKSQWAQHVHKCPRPWHVSSAALGGGACPQSHWRLLHRACPDACVATDGKASERHAGTRNRPAKRGLKDATPPSRPRGLRGSAARRNRRAAPRLQAAHSKQRVATSELALSMHLQRVRPGAAPEQGAVARPSRPTRARARRLGGVAAADGRCTSGSWSSMRCWRRR